MKRVFETIYAWHIGILIAVLCYLFLLKEENRNKSADFFVMIALIYYIIILGYIAQHYYLQAERKLREKMPPFIPKMVYALLIINFLVFQILELNKIQKRIKSRLLFENKDPRCLGVEDLGLSERVKFVLIKQKGMLSLDKLIMIVLDTPESILEIEGLDDEGTKQIFRKTYDFINTSYALTALFYSNHDKLKVKPWWYVYTILLTRKDPQFRFITELGLSRRVTILLLYQGIYMIAELLTIVSNTQGCEYLLLYIEDFQYEDFLEIFLKLEWWYGMVRKKKEPVFKFITQLSLSERVTLLLFYEDIFTIEELKRTIKKPKSCKALLEIEDFADEDFFEIFTKLEGWYRLVRKKKDSVFRFITELGLSPRVTVLLFYEDIFTIEELKRTIKKPKSCKALLEIEDFADEDFFEIFTKLEGWYRLVRKKKDSVFRFITELGLSPRVTVLLLKKGIDTIDELRRTIKDVIFRKALLEIEDFADEEFCEIFKKLEEWYRLVRKKKDSVFRFITELGLSPRVTVLLLKKGLYTVKQLQLTLRDPETHEILLQMEDFENEDLLEIFKKVDWC